MIDNISSNTPVKAYGPGPVVARARFNGQLSATPALVDAFGIKSIAQTTTTSGLFTVTLQDKIPEFTPVVTTVAAGGDLHDCPVTAVDFVNGTFTFSHYIQASRTGAHALSNGLSPLVAFNILVHGRGTL